MAEDQKSVSNDQSNHTGAWVLIVLGVLFLVQKYTGFDVWENFWPLALIVIGVGMLLRRNQK